MHRHRKFRKASAGWLVAILLTALPTPGLFPFLQAGLFFPPAFAAGDREGWKHFKDEGSRYEVFRDFAGAERVYQKSLKLATRQTATPAERGEVMARLANSMIWQQKFDQAEPYFNELLTMIPRLRRQGARNEDFFSCIDSLSNAYFERILGFRRISGIQHSIRLIDTAFGEKHPDLLKELVALSYTYAALGQNSEALAFANRAYALSKKDTSERGQILAWKTLTLVGVCRKSAGDWSGAQKALQEAVVKISKSPKGYSLSAASALAQLAIVDFHLHKKNDAKELFQFAERIYLPRIKELERKGKNSISTAGPDLLALAQMYVAFNQYEKAEPICKLSIEWTQLIFGPKDANLINELRVHGFVLSRLGRMKESQKQEAAALELAREYKITPE